MKNNLSAPRLHVSVKISNQIKNKIYEISPKALPILIFLMQACNSPEKAPQLKVTLHPIPVRLLKLDQEASKTSLEASGKFTTQDETVLSFKTSGIIHKILVKEGDLIHKGQLLASIKTDEIDARVQQAQLNLEKGERDYLRYQKLFRDSVITQEQLENYKTTRDVIKEQVKAARFDLQYSKILSTVNGYVLKKIASEGQEINTGTPILQINGAEDSPWILQVGISDFLWSRINIGDTARVYSDSRPLTPFQGRVVRKSHGVDQSSGLNQVDIQILGPSKFLATGMYGKVRMSLMDKSVYKKVPLEAVLDACGNQAFVYITLDKRTAHKVPIEISSFDESEVLVKKGLENGGMVITAGSAYLSEGSPIKIIQ